MSVETVTLADVTNAEKSLQKLLNNCDIPIMLAYNLSSLVEVVESESKKVENLRVKLVKKYGLKGDDNIVTVRPDKMQDFANEMDSVLSQIIKVERVCAKLDDLKTCKLNALELTALKKIIKISIK